MSCSCPKSEQGQQFDWIQKKAWKVKYLIGLCLNYMSQPGQSPPNYESTRFQDSLLVHFWVLSKLLTSLHSPLHFILRPTVGINKNLTHRTVTVPDFNRTYTEPLPNQINLHNELNRTKANRNRLHRTEANQNELHRTVPHRSEEYLTTPKRVYRVLYRTALLKVLYTILYLYIYERAFKLYYIE